MKNLRILLPALLLIGGVLLWAGLRSPPGPATTAAVQGDVRDPEPGQAALADAADGAVPGLPPNASQFNEEAFIADLRERFLPHLHRPHAQIRSLEQLISYLKAQYPNDWEERVLDMLRRIFPEQADALYARFQSLMSYTAFLEENRAELRRMPAAERRATLWAAREAHFGPAAKEIWAAELKSQALGDALKNLPAEASSEQKISQFRQAIDDIYGEQAAGLIANRRTELINGFLAEDSVQQELRELPAAERHATLQTIRREMGMDEAALQRWQDLDQQRDQTWARGQSYMQARRDILEQYPEADRDWRLNELRENTFGPEATIIANEEAAGFFRFDHTRRIGRE